MKQPSLKHLSPQEKADIILDNPHHTWYWNKWRQYYKKSRYEEIVNEFLVYLDEVDAWNKQKPDSLWGGDAALKRQLGTLEEIYLL